MKKKEFREPETVQSFVYFLKDGQMNIYSMWHQPTSIHTTKVRIIRERDYQRLLRLAKGGGRKR